MAITFDVSIIERSNFGIIISIIDFDISNKQKTFFCMGESFNVTTNFVKYVIFYRLSKEVTG